MKPIPVTEKVSVIGQLQPEEFVELARRGFKTIINNRPDGEEASQPGTAAEEAAARVAAARGSAQNSTRERAPRQDSHPEFTACRQHLQLHLAMYEVIQALLRNESMHVAPGRGSLAARDVQRREVAGSNIEDLPLLHEPAHGVPDLFP